MTKDRKYKDTALRKAFQQEMATKSHFQLADGWQDDVMRQIKPMSRRLIWTAAAIIVVLIIGSATFLWKNEKGDKFQMTNVCHQEVEVPQVETPVTTQTIPAQTGHSNAVPKPTPTYRKRSRINNQTRQEPDEMGKALAPSSLSANRDRMRQAMMEKMNIHSDMRDFEPEIHDKI